VGGHAVTITVNAKLGPHEDYKVLHGYFASRANEVDVIRGPLGSGKTWTSLQRILCEASEQEPTTAGVRLSRWIALRCTYAELDSTTIRDAEKFFRPFGGVVRRGSPPTLKARFALGDRTKVDLEILFIAGLNDPEAEAQFRGIQATSLWANELREIPRGPLLMAFSRCGRFPARQVDGAHCTRWGMIADTNSYDVDHWLYKAFEEERPHGWKLWSQPGGVLRSQTGGWEENPDAENLGHLPKGYYRRNQAGRSDDWIAVNLGNEYAFTTDGKPVHPQYVDAIHCAKAALEPDKRWPLIVGIDFGRTPAATVWQRDPVMDRWLGLGELVTTNMPASTFGPELKRWLDRTFPGYDVKAYGDPAGDKAGQTVDTTPIQLIRAAGVPCSPAPTNNALLRRAALERPMRRNCMDGKPAFLISPAMKVTRKGLLGGFCYRRLRIHDTERYTEEPDKNQYSHPVESAEYALLSGGERHAMRKASFVDDRAPQRGTVFAEVD